MSTYLCPLCRTMYSDCRELGFVFSFMETCGNQAWDREEDPNRDRPPCPGKLRTMTRKDVLDISEREDARLKQETIDALSPEDFY